MIWIWIGVVGAAVVGVVSGLVANERRKALALTMSESWIAEHVETDGKTGHGF